MKTLSRLLARTLTLTFVATALGLGAPTLRSAEKPGHAHPAPPKGGRFLDKTEPRAELVVEKDRGVSIHFYNDDLKTVPATTQAVTVIAEAKGGKATLQFEKKDAALVSKSKLPEGEGYTVVVQFRQTADAKPNNLRFKLDLGPCAECKRPEYACICGH